MSPPAHGPIDELLTLRDWLRYAVSRFNAAKLVYGHGTTTALDEAAFLILSTLNLPIDELDPWLEARLTSGERQAVASLIEQRITTRKPASYLTRSAYIGGHRFYVDERAIIPRSFIGELLIQDPALLAGADPGDITRVLDLCTGSGCLAILAALAFPDAKIDAADISPDALAVAAVNVAEYGLDDRVRMIKSDLFAALRGERYDLIICNPPYVTAAAVAAFPPEYQAEPRLAHLGGTDGMDIVRRVLRDAATHISSRGSLIVEVGQARDVLEQDFPGTPFLWLDTKESQGEVFALPADALPPADLA